ncbi:MAG: response regulator [Nitrospirae bacterium]|nr:response regulator [Nitrospirota bacterium]MDA1304959.1 response regulator [Nitrospirota bacterium]
MNDILTAESNIVVIDKDHARRTLYVSFLEPARVQTTGNYKEGLRMLKRSAIDLVIVRVMLSQESSHRFLRALGKLGKKIPCLALFPGSESIHDMLATASWGVTDFLFLPLNWEEVSLRVKWHLIHSMSNSP